MARPAPWKLTLADLMILIGGTAVSLACFLLIDNNLYGGGRSFFGLFNAPKNGWNATLVLDKAQGGFALAMTMIGAWTFALPVLGFLKPRPIRRRLFRGPGLAACLAACVGIVTCVGATVLAFVLRWIDGRSTLPTNYWYITPVLESLFIFSGIAVASAWTAQLLTGRWRPTPNAIDRLGRFMGALWASSGLVFAVRLFL
jgi:hypothetical protein